MTVKIPPSLLDEAFTDRLDGLDIDSNEGRRALFMVIPRKHPLVAFLQQFTRSGGAIRTPDGRVLYADPRYSVTKCKTIQSQKACNPHTYPHKHR